MKNKMNDNQPRRASIIESVQTPLGFFSLTVLVVEIILGLTANFSQGSDRTYLIISMVVLIFLLVLIVAGFAYFRPEALRGRRPIFGHIPNGTRTMLPPEPQVSPISTLSQKAPIKTKEGQEEIVVLSATYGKGETKKDVTGVIKAIVAAAASGCARFTVNNGTLGGDPLKRQKKELTIVYSYTGETRTITVRERGECSLP
jgi:hypothetical protein